MRARREDLNKDIGWEEEMEMRMKKHDYEERGEERKRIYERKGGEK